LCKRASRSSRFVVDLGSVGGENLTASSVWCGSGRACAVVEPRLGDGVSTLLKCWGLFDLGRDDGGTAVGREPADFSNSVTTTVLATAGEALDVVKVVLIGRLGHSFPKDTVVLARSARLSRHHCCGRPPRRSRELCPLPGRQVVRLARKPTASVTTTAL
jgi:hypothetical protein